MCDLPRHGAGPTRTTVHDTQTQGGRLLMRQAHWRNALWQACAHADKRTAALSRSLVRVQISSNRYRLLLVYKPE